MAHPASIALINLDRDDSSTGADLEINTLPRSNETTLTSAEDQNGVLLCWYEAALLWSEKEKSKREVRIEEYVGLDV